MSATCGACEGDLAEDISGFICLACAYEALLEQVRIIVNTLDSRETADIRASLESALESADRTGRGRGR